MTLPGNEGAEPATSCPICAFNPEVDDDNPMYDCSSCGEEFTQQESADASSNRCPQCRRFARRVADHNCEYVSAEREEAEDRCSGLESAGSTQLFPLREASPLRIRRPGAEDVHKLPSCILARAAA